MTTKLRIDEVLVVIGNVLDQDNRGATLGTPDPTFSELSDPDSAITLVDNLNQTADITAVAPGEAVVLFQAFDLFGDGVQAEFAVQVLDAVGFTFALGDEVDLTIATVTSSSGVLRKLIPTVLLANCECVATPVDEQGLSHADYTAGLTNISWTRTTGTSINFDIGGGPVGSVTGTLTPRIMVNTVGDCLVTLSATNSSGDVISSTINFRVIGASTAEVVEAT